MPKVITFYSYKGGVGRSFALANVAATLASWGAKVAVMDWDLEAPGISQYFEGWLETNFRDRVGVVDLILAYQAFHLRATAGRVVGTTEMASAKAANVSIGSALKLRRYFSEANLGDVHGKNGGSLSVMTAGKAGEDYPDRLHKVNWNDLYLKHDFGSFIEWLRAELFKSYDFVFVDSRTGVSDTSGICTVQLPDVLVVPVAPNKQNIVGSRDILRRIISARQSLAVDRSNLYIVPVLSRFDFRSELEQAKRWALIAAENLLEHTSAWISANPSLVQERIFDALRIPHYSYWSFGERLPALEEVEQSAELISYSIDNIAAFLAKDLVGIDGLVTDRDSYVRSARESMQQLASARAHGSAFKYECLISYSAETQAYARKMAELLEEKGINTFLDSVLLIQGDSAATDIEAGIQQSRHMVVLVGEHLNRMQESEVFAFMKRMSSQESVSTGGMYRTIVPVFLTDQPPKSVLLSFNGIIKGLMSDEEIAEKIYYFFTGIGLSDSRFTLSAKAP
jgi:cellulose biosynthesis protein BcsQ